LYRGLSGEIAIGLNDMVVNLSVAIVLDFRRRRYKIAAELETGLTHCRQENCSTSGFLLSMQQTRLRVALCTGMHGMPRQLD
jgi:hypothetical protein